MRTLSCVLLLAITLTACAPLAAAPAPVSTSVPPAQPAATSTPAAVEGAAPSAAPTTHVVGTPLGDTTSPRVAATVQPIATSRGPGLHATDPATVSLASGSLQLIEFFRFT